VGRQNVLYTAIHDVKDTTGDTLRCCIHQGDPKYDPSIYRLHASVDGLSWDLIASSHAAHDKPVCSEPSNQRPLPEVCTASHSPLNITSYHMQRFLKATTTKNALKAMIKASSSSLTPYPQERNADIFFSFSTWSCLWQYYFLIFGKGVYALTIFSAGFGMLSDRMF